TACLFRLSLRQGDAGGLVWGENDLHPAVQLAPGIGAVIGAGLVLGHRPQVHALTLDTTEAQHVGHRLGPFQAQLLVQFVTAVAVAVADYGEAAGAVDLQRLCYLAQWHQAGRQQQGALGMEVAIDRDQQADLFAFTLDLVALLGSQRGEVVDAGVGPGRCRGSLYYFLLRGTGRKENQRSQRQGFYDIHVLSRQWETRANWKSGHRLPLQTRNVTIKHKQFIGL